MTSIEAATGSASRYMSLTKKQMSQALAMMPEDALIQTVKAMAKVVDRQWLEAALDAGFVSVTPEVRGERRDRSDWRKRCDAALGFLYRLEKHYPEIKLSEEDKDFLQDVVCRRILDEYARVKGDANFAYRGGRSTVAKCMSLAIVMGRTEFLKTLVEAHPDCVNACAPAGWDPERWVSPLYYALRSNNLACVEVLLPGLDSMATMAAMENFDGDTDYYGLVDALDCFQLYSLASTIQPVLRHVVNETFAKNDQSARLALQDCAITTMIKTDEAASPHKVGAFLAEGLYDWDKTASLQAAIVGGQGPVLDHYRGAFPWKEMEDWLASAICDAAFRGHMHVVKALFANARIDGAERHLTAAMNSGGSMSIDNVTFLLTQESGQKLLAQMLQVGLDPRVKVKGSKWSIFDMASAIDAVPQDVVDLLSSSRTRHLARDALAQVEAVIDAAASNEPKARVKP